MVLKTIPQLSRAKASLARNEVRLHEIEKLMRAPHELLLAGVKRVTPLVRGLLLTNLSASGIQSHSGRLRGAIDRVGVALGSAGLVYFMPEGIADYISKSGKHSSFYRVAGALNYGAVRMPQVMRFKVDLPTGRAVRYGKHDIAGAKVKATLKKIALGGAVSARALSNLQKGYTLRHGQARGRKIGGGLSTEVKNSTDKSVAVGDTVVIRPRPFFILSNAQRAMVREAFIEFVLEALRARVA